MERKAVLDVREKAQRVARREALEEGAVLRLSGQQLLRLGASCVQGAHESCKAALPLRRGRHRAVCLGAHLPIRVRAFFGPSPRAPAPLFAPKIQWLIGKYWRGLKRARASV